ncbi:MAG TPA: hypothetical protein VHG35_07705, partial [Gemmatimonadales bacterium]|nr:hypothetical protein [Gemmatimonadales bacterium]
MTPAVPVESCPCEAPASQDHEQSPDRAEILADPAPSAPGIFLGSAVTPTACTDGSQADTDRDGLA